jgi:hypothetical protein
MYMKKPIKVILAATLLISITCSCYSPPERRVKQVASSAGKDQDQQKAIGQPDSRYWSGPVAVGFHGGLLRGETIEWKARTFLKKHYKDFSPDPSNHGLMLFRPMNPTNCVTIRLRLRSTFLGG